MAGKRWSEGELTLLKSGTKQVPGRTHDAVLDMRKRLAIHDPDPYAHRLSETDCKLVAWSIVWEGHISLFSNSCNGMIPLVGVTNTDLKSLEKFQVVVGAGFITKPHSRGYHRPIYHWIISGRRGVEWLLAQIHEYLPDKRKRSSTVLKWCRGEMSDGDAWRAMRELNR